MSAEIITEVMLLPDGMEADHINATTFAVFVRWRGAPTPTGRGGYAIMSGSQHLSHGGKWRFSPQPFVQRHFRWRDLDSALVVARSFANSIKVNGRTWAEWQELRLTRGEEQS